MNRKWLSLCKQNADTLQWFIVHRATEDVDEEDKITKRSAGTGVLPQIFPRTLFSGVYREEEMVSSLEGEIRRRQVDV